MMGSELLLPPYLRQLPGRERMLAGSQRQGTTCCLELGCGQDKVNIPARKLCRGGGPCTHPSPMRASVWTGLATRGHQVSHQMGGQPCSGCDTEFSAALNVAQETKGLKEGKGDVTRSRRGQRVEKSKAIVCLGPAQLEMARKPITATSGQVPSFIEQGLKNLRGNYPD